MLASLFKEITVTGYHLLKNYRAVAIYEAIGVKSTEEVIAKIEKASLKTLNANLSKIHDGLNETDTILEKVLKEGNVKMLKTLLDKGIDVNSTPCLEHLFNRHYREEVEKMNNMLDLMLGTDINLNWHKEVKTSSQKPFVATYLKIMLERIGRFQVFNETNAYNSGLELYKNFVDKCVAHGMVNCDSTENLIVYAISQGCQEDILVKLFNMDQLNKTSLECKREFLDLLNEPNKQFEFSMDHSVKNQERVDKILDWAKSYLEKECLMNSVAKEIENDKPKKAKKI